jgi:hypothetical protein
MIPLVDLDTLVLTVTNVGRRYGNINSKLSIKRDVDMEFSYRVIDIWNALPANVREHDSFTSFKRALNHYYINLTTWNFVNVFIYFFSTYLGRPFIRVLINNNNNNNNNNLKQGRFQIANFTAQLLVSLGALTPPWTVRYTEEAKLNVWKKISVEKRCWKKLIFSPIAGWPSRLSFILNMGSK